MFKVHNKDTRCRSGVFIVNFGKYLTPCSTVSIVNFKHVIADWKNPVQ